MARHGIQRDTGRHVIQARYEQRDTVDTGYSEQGTQLATGRGTRDMARHGIQRDTGRHVIQARYVQRDTVDTGFSGTRDDT